MEKLSNIINLEKIAFELYDQDIKILENSQSSFPKLTTSEFQKFIHIDKKNHLKNYVSHFSELVDEFTDENNLELAVLANKFFQRYSYLYKTNEDYLGVVESLTQDIITLPETTFEKIFAPFFVKQINFKLEDFLSYIKKSNLKKWNENLFEHYTIISESILIEENFAKKLDQIETLVLEFQNQEELLDLINIDNSDEKKEFTIFLDDLKIEFQTMDILIEKILKKLIEVSNV